MVKQNAHYSKLPGNFLFPEIERRVASRTSILPLLNLGIGDVSQPLIPSVVQALSEAAQEMGDPTAFRGYGPPEGYLFLREAISRDDYNGQIKPEEIFISDGAKGDLANLQEIFCTSNRVAVPDPTYPVYLDATIMGGRTRMQLKNGRFGGLTYLACKWENGFCPEPPGDHCDLVYLCSPNNPTGTAMNRELLSRWVEYAKIHQAILLFDGAYEAFIQSKDTPRSIYEIEGAKQVAIEVRSFSKTAGFSGIRLSYTVIPHELEIYDCGRKQRIHPLWKRRHETKYNGASYLSQKGALALYTPKGKAEMAERIASYQKGAKELLCGLQEIGLSAYGGIDAPYIWCKTPRNLPSWDFFDCLLNQAGIISVPGSGFGTLGEGFIRFSGFAKLETIDEALKRLKTCIE